MKQQIGWFLTGFVLAMGCGNGGSDNNNNGTNNGTTQGTNNGTTAVSGECATNDDCPGGSDATFARPENAVCTAGIDGNYCSECVNDAQCMTGEACRDATFCYTLPACTVGEDCSDNPGEVHQACIDGFCKDCVDDADCGDGEVCYSRRCATRDTVDPTCVDATCEGPCDITYDADNTPTGVACTP